MLCKECGSEVIQLEHPREGRCEMCDDTITYSTVPSPTLCEKCAREFHVCESCMKPLVQDGFPFADEFIEKSKEMTVDEARAYGFNEAINIGLTVVAPGMCIHPRDPKNPEDRLALRNEFAEELNFQCSMAEEEAIDEAAKIFGIKRWNSSDRLYSMREKRDSATMTDVIIRLEELVRKKADEKSELALINSYNWNICQLLIRTLTDCFGLELREASDLTYDNLRSKFGEDLPVDELLNKFIEVVKGQLQKK